MASSGGASPRQRNICNVAFWVGGCLIAAFGLLLLSNFDPQETTWFPKCPLYVTTGLFCPGCGATRAIHALLHGHFEDALAWNPLVLAVPLVVAVSLRQGWVTQTWFAQALCLSLLLFGVLRNIPLAPFRYLAPH